MFKTTSSEILDRRKNFRMEDLETGVTNNSTPP